MKNGNTYVTGKSKGTNSGFDIVTIKYNSDGAQQWVNSYNGSSNKDDFASNIVIDVFGNSYVCGSENATRNSLVFKISSLGVRGWVNSINLDFAFEGNTASAIILNNVGNVLVAMSAGIDYKYKHMSIALIMDFNCLNIIPLLIQMLRLEGFPIRYYQIQLAIFMY
ncbi:MAG: SBBP repeat-containing protein [Saprospiraceae bacterium]|nr:SBBP repeat-containing protein [Saprospiraceae bacterium]